MPANLAISKAETSTRYDPKQDADYIFYELTRSICPECRRVIDAKILLCDNWEQKIEGIFKDWGEI